MRRIYLGLIGLLLCTSLYAYDGISNQILSGRQTVTTAGTRVQLSTADIAVAKVVITAETDNTGYVVVGSGDVVATVLTRVGIPLNAGESIVICVNNLNKVYLDSTVNTDGVTWMAYK